MCVIIYRGVGHDLKESTIQNCMLNNSDGWGIMYYSGGSIVTERGLDPGSFWKAYDAIPTNQEIAIHFRWRTHGAVDLSNTHPYPVLTGSEDGADVVLMHNGIIDLKFEMPNNSMSDTWHWIRDVVRPTLGIAPSLLKTSAYRFLLEQTTEGSRLLFLDGSGTFTFLHQDDWQEIEGCLFSNSYSHKSPVQAMHMAWGDEGWPEETWTPSKLRQQVVRNGVSFERLDGDFYEVDQDLYDVPPNLGWTRRYAYDLVQSSFHLLDYDDAEQLVFYHQDVVMDWFVDRGFDREFDLTLSDDLHEVADFMHLKAIAARSDLEDARKLAAEMLINRQRSVSLAQDRTTRP